MTWKLVFTKQAQKDSRKLASAELKTRTMTLLEVLKENPFQSPHKTVVGDLSGAFSRRINIQHRLIYQVLKEEKIVKVLRMWTHYE